MLNSFTIKNRLLLLILTPLVATVILGYSYIQRIHTEYNAAASLDKYVSYLPDLSNVIHSLQKERGASYGYLNKENRKKFEDILNKEIKQTNEHLLRTRGIRKIVNISELSPKAANILNEFPQKVNLLIAMRQDIKSGKVDQEALFKFYSKLILSYISLIEELNWFNISADTNNTLITYTYFMLWKEYTGQERALGAGGFGGGRFNKDAYHKFLKKIAEVKTFKGLFMGKASIKEQSYIYDIVNSPINREINEIEEFLTHNGLDDAEILLSGVEWYRLLSEKINLMNTAEQKIIDHLLQKTAQIKTEKTILFTLILALVIVLFLAAIVLSLAIAQSISRPIKNIGQVMKQVITGNKLTASSQNIPHMTEKNEIGTLSRQFSDMLQTIIIQKRSLKTERNKAQAADQAKSSFLANMSHELRTPLNAIIGFSEIMNLNKEKTIEDNSSYISYIHDSGQHLLRLVNNILDIAQISTGDSKLAKDLFSLQNLIIKCFSELCEDAKQNGISLSHNITENGLMIQADHHKLHKVFMSLISNAIKFSSEKGEVSVHADLTGKNDPTIIIKDTGVGMNETEQMQAFQIFGQVEEVYSRDHQGMGLGLPIARGIIELHGGTLTLESAPDIGTKVIITLPQDRLVTG